MSEGDWAHELWVPRVVLRTNSLCIVMYWSSVCVLNGRDKEPGQAEMGLTILLMGFRLGRRGWARRLQFGLAQLM